MRIFTILKTFGLALAGLTLLVAAPARAEWLRAETEHFVIIGDTGRGSITEYARKVERFHSLLALFRPPEQEDVVAPKLWIYLAEGRADMRQVWPTISEHVGGFYSRSDDRIFAVVDTDNEGSDTTLFHEYAHHYMYQYHNAAYPGWFVEGFAEYFAPSEMGIRRVRYGLYNPGRLFSLQDTNSWVPMEDVLRSRLTLTSARRGAAYYAQAWLVTHYMLERRVQMSAYLAAVARGEEPIDALATHIGRTPDQLRRELRSYLSSGITVYTLQQALPEAEVTVTSLPRSTGDVVWLDLRSARAIGDDGPALVARAQAAATRNPGDRLPAVVLAKLQRETEDLDGARRTLEPVLAEWPEDAEAQWLMGVVLSEQAEATEDDAARQVLTRQARTHLAAAYEADPLDYRIYLALLDNRRGAPGFPSDNDVTIAESAWRLAPQIGTTAFEAAQLLMFKERYLEAAYVLAPLANNPHGGDSLAPVRTLLAEAREKAGLGPTFVEAPPDADAAAEAGTPEDEGPEGGGAQRP
jgi:Protein of unknown function (DUF1570)